MNPFTAYRKTLRPGEVLYSGKADEPMALASEDEGILVGEEVDASFYILEGLEGPYKAPLSEMSPVFDKAQIAADGLEVATLSGLPDPCTLTITDPEGKRGVHEVAGGSEQINTDLIGTHTVEVEAFPFLPWKGSFDGY